VVNGYFGTIVREALARAEIEKPMREYHDWRHTGITNAAAAGMSPLSIMRMAGHSDFKTKQRYIDLAGVVFGDDVRRLSDWYGSSGTNNRYQVEADDPQTRIASGFGAISD
jgi:integrase